MQPNPGFHDNRNRMKQSNVEEKDSTSFGQTFKQWLKKKLEMQRWVGYKFYRHQMVFITL